VKRLSSATLAALAALGLAACSSETPSSPSLATAKTTSTAAEIPGQYIVLFRGNAVPVDFAAKVTGAGGKVVYANGNAGFAFVSGLPADAATKIGAMGSVAQVRGDNVLTVETPKAAAEAVVTDVVTSQANPTTAARYSWQWNMRLIHANTAWAAGHLGSASVTAAILDTGIDYDAPDLNGLVDLSRSTSFIPTDDAITNTYLPTRHVISDYNGHGTNVATQVSSKAFALAGVTSKTTLIGVKVLDATGHGSFGAVLSGVLWAADHGANVANMSLGGGFTKAANGQHVAEINRVFTYAQGKGMLIVVSAGNSAADLDRNGNAMVTYCNAVHVVCVSAVGPTTWTGDANAPAFFTNFGRSAIDVAGPGGNAQLDEHGHAVPSAWPWGIDIASWVWSYCSKTRIATDAAGNLIFQPGGAPVLTVCAAGNRISGFIGTSQASPHVTGLAALLVAEKGISTPALLKAAIEKSAVDLGQPGVDPLYGSGRIDVARALGL
jgi:hypothetical protein